jgi:light-regulated signal transduction histidine kinase (bacteriophytochrome)
MICLDKATNNFCHIDDFCQVFEPSLEKRKYISILSERQWYGIPENQFKNIFKSINPNKDSSGIGLVLCKKIAELHGGKIWLASKLEEGTTFYFTIPMHCKH